MIFALAAAAVTIPLGHHQPACPDRAVAQSYTCKAVQADKAGDDGQAAADFEQAAQLAKADDPSGARAWAAAGNMWIAAGDPAKAAVDLDRALSGTALQGLQRGEALLDRARAAEDQGDDKMARAKLTEAQQTVSADPFLWYFSAALALRENDVATAKDSIGRALTLVPNDATMLFEAGHVEEVAGDDAGARDYWTRAAAADPNGDIGKAARQALTVIGPALTVKMDGPAKP